MSVLHSGKLMKQLTQEKGSRIRKIIVQIFVRIIIRNPLVKLAITLQKNCDAKIGSNFIS